MRLVYQAWYTVARFGLSVGRFAPSGTRRELYSCTMYDAGKGIRTGYYYDDMVAPERDALIVRLRCKGWSLRPKTPAGSGFFSRASLGPCKGLLKAGSVEILGAELNVEA